MNSPIRTGRNINASNWMAQAQTKESQFFDSIKICSSQQSLDHGRAVSGPNELY